MINNEKITDDFIQEIVSRLQDNKRIRRTLPRWGRIHIDRQLPFLCIYRQPTRRQDVGTEHLIMGQPAYVMTTAHKSLSGGLAKLVSGITTTLSDLFGNFLIIEIWTSPNEKTDVENVLELNAPAFKIFASNQDGLPPTLTTLENELTRFVIEGQRSQVTLDSQAKPHPARFPNLLDQTTLGNARHSLIGIAVKPIYQQTQSGEILPLVHQKMTADFNKALQRTAFTFVRTQTTFRPPHYQMLGRRATVKAVWQIDKQLAQISNGFDFLLQVTPLNPAEAWTQFRRARYTRPPTFHYRPHSVDPALLKRQLWNIRLERVEDPTLQHLFREKRQELDIQISMMANLNKPSFFFGSLQLYGQLDDSLIALSKMLLDRISPQSREGSRGQSLTAREFADHARQYIRRYRQLGEDFDAKVSIRTGLTGLMVSHGNLLVADDLKIAHSRVEALLAHEVGIHVLTYYNGKAQPFQLLQSGLAGYEELQEGLAVLAEYLVGGLSKPRLRLLAARVLAAQNLIQGASFIDTYSVLRDDYGFRQKIAFNITMRIYRGGGLTKDAVYLRGLVQLLQYLQDKPLQDLFFIGKIAIDHVPIIRELQRRKVLHEPNLRPYFLENEQTKHRLERLKQDITILDLIDNKRITP